MLRREPPFRVGFRASTIFTATIVLSLFGCQGAETERGPGEAARAPTEENGTDPRAIIDAAGVAHVFEHPARRIVSLVPSATATLRALGAEPLLVGRTDYDTDDWLASIPSVGGGLEPNLEALLALKPDLVIRFEGEQDPRTPARLDEFGIRHVGVRPVSLADIYLTNEIVGAATGRRDQADSLSAAIRAGLEELEERVAHLPRLAVAYVLGGSPPWVAGTDTYISEIVSIAGGDNVFPALRMPYSAISPEELRTRAIDVVLVSDAGAFDESLVPGARIVVIGGVLEVPGPDVVPAAWHVAELMHGVTLR
jgi:ABC-type Fe3+-hydroxamate transport system substrate-binding protein